MKNYKVNHLSDILSDIESNISPQNRCRAINFTSPNSMNVPLSKEHGLFTIWAIIVTHDKLEISCYELCLTYFLEQKRYLLIITFSF